MSEALREQNQQTHQKDMQAIDFNQKVEKIEKELKLKDLETQDFH